MFKLSKAELEVRSSGSLLCFISDFSVWCGCPIWSFLPSLQPGLDFELPELAVCIKVSVPSVTSLGVLQSHRSAHGNGSKPLEPLNEGRVALRMVLDQWCICNRRAFASFSHCQILLPRQLWLDFSELQNQTGTTRSLGGIYSLDINKVDSKWGQVSSKNNKIRGQE